MFGNLRQMQAQVTQFTSIGRTLDPTYPHHAIILLLTLAGGIASGGLALLRGADLGAAVAAGFWTGAAVFIAWVLARELDIDRERSALVAAGLALAGALLAGGPAPAILPLATLIILCRLVNRVVGPPFRWTDSLAVLALAGLLALTGETVMVFAVALAFLLDALLPPPLRRHALLALLAAGAGFVLLAGQGLALAALSGPVLAVGGLSLVAFGLTMIATRRIDTDCDVPEYALEMIRVQMTMAFAALLALILLLTGGDVMALRYLPLWATLAGIPAYRLLEYLRGALARAA
jgi:hypothetical protein